MHEIFQYIKQNKIFDECFTYKDSRNNEYYVEFTGFTKYKIYKKTEVEQNEKIW